MRNFCQTTIIASFFKICQKNMYQSPFFRSQSPKSNWQQQLACAVSEIGELYRLLGLTPPEQAYQPSKFPLRVPHAFIAKMQKGNANDPLLLQVLPDIAETLTIAGYSHDPLAENTHNPSKGLLHKYKNRVLITTTGACALHCRYCFRQHFDYGANLPSTHEMNAIADYIGADPRISEVLLSGGDPLSLSNRRLMAWFETLSALPAVKTIRLHTRLPVVVPDRVDDELLQLLKNCPKQVVMVLHINHANEIDQILADKCHALKQAGTTLLNQTVLLKNINDDVQTLCNLSERLFSIGVLPYYLHILDKVAGSAHFDVPLVRAVELYWQLLENLSGYLVPKLVQELPNRPYKTPVDIYQFDTNKPMINNQSSA